MFKKSITHAALHGPKVPGSKGACKILGSVAFSFFILQCGLDVEDPTPPSPPKWVQKSLPEEWPERGIDAHESGGIYLEWEASTAEDILAYNIYRAVWSDVNDGLNEYSLLVRLEVEPTAGFEYVDRQTEYRKRYFYKLKSEDSSNNLSRYSAPVFYSRGPQVGSMEPNGVADPLDTERKLRWYYDNSLEMEDYILTLLSNENELVTRVRLSPGNYLGHLENWRIPIDIPLEFGKNYHWRIDASARYVDGRETFGSESQWATLYYVGN